MESSEIASIPQTQATAATDIDTAQTTTATKLKAILLHLLLILLISVGCEIFVWNSYYWSFDAQKYTRQEFSLPLQDHLQRNALVLSEQNNVIKISQLNKMFTAIEMEVYGGSPMVKGTIQATSTNQVYLPQNISNFCVASGLNQDIHSVAQDYQHTLIKFDLPEPVIDLIISFDPKTLTSPIAITKLIFNPAPVFKFSIIRVIIMIMGLSLAYVLLCSQLYRHTMLVDSHCYKWVNRSIFAFMLLCSSALFAVYHPSVISDTGYKFISLGFLPYGTPDGSALQEIPTTQEGLGNVDPYIELTDALLVKHQLNVDLWVDPEMLRLNNMFDASERTAKNVKFYLDRAFAHGKYYVYFGLAPIIMIYAPIYLLTGLVPGAVLAIFIATLYALLGLHLLSSRLTTLLCQECNTTLFVISKITLYACSLAFMLQTELTFYRLPYLTAMAALCIAISCALGLLLKKKGKSTSIDTQDTNTANTTDSTTPVTGVTPATAATVANWEENTDTNRSLNANRKKQGRLVQTDYARSSDGSWSADQAASESASKLMHWYQKLKANLRPQSSTKIPFTWHGKQMGAMALCGLAIVLVVMSRPLSLLYLFSGVGICYLVYLIKVQQSVTNKVLNSLCLAIPVLLGAIVVCAYNYARFDSIFEFGAFQQVTGDYIKSNFVHVSLPLYKTAILSTLFANFEFSSSFPYIGLNWHIETQLGQYVYFVQHGGLLRIPYYWGLALLPMLWKMKGLSHHVAQRFSLPPLWGLRAIQLIITSWYVTFPVMLILIVCNAGWSNRYMTDITAIATLLPFTLVMLLKFTWQSDIERIFYIAWIACCLVSCFMMFFLCINNDETNLDFINPRAYLFLKEIFDPLGFN